MAFIAQSIIGKVTSVIAALNPPNEPDPLPPIGHCSLPFRHPSPKNVLDVKRLLFDRFKLPLELADAIIDYAEYWPCTTVTTEGKNFSIGGYGGTRRIEDELIVRTLFPSVQLSH